MGLVSLPERFGQLRSLVELTLCGCNNLEYLPEGMPAHILALPAACLSLRTIELLMNDRLSITH